MSKPFKLGVLFTHATQHHSPLWQRLAKEKDIDIHVMYLSSENIAEGTGDRELRSNTPWDVDLLSGYSHEFLKNWDGKVSKKVKKSLLCPGLFSRLKKQNYQAIWLSSFVTYSHRLAFFLCKSRGIKIISQNDACMMSETGYYSRFMRAFRTSLYPRLYDLTDYWLPIGNHNEIHLRFFGVPESKMFPAPYPFDRKRFEEAISNNQEAIQAIRSKFSKNSETILYGFAAKWIKRKNPLDFIEAIRLAHQKNPNIYGLLIGGGELEPEIDKKLSSMNGEVIKVGFINQSKLPLYYAAMDVFVCPSSIDSHPLVVSEAMAAGKPVILSDRCGNWGYNDILQHRYNGLVFPCNNVEKLCEAILELSDKEVRLEYSKRAKEVVKTHDLEQTAKILMKVIEKIKENKA
jgi:glycosyltransferase involved in cell wall biosynthesis